MSARRPPLLLERRAPLLRPYSGRLAKLTNFAHAAGWTAMVARSRHFVSRTMTSAGSLSATSTQFSVPVYVLVRQFGFWVILSSISDGNTQ